MSFNIERLGGYFGDENDIAIFNCLGASISLYFLFFNHNFYVKITSLLLFALFTYCGIASGSKIVLFLLSAIALLFIVLTNGRKKWWLSLTETAFIVLAGIAILNLPFASELKQRFLNMINLFTKSQIPGASTRDLSTTDRLYMLFDGFEMFLKKPLFGFGINGFSNYGGINNGWSHNHVSEILCNTGLAGTFFYHVPFFVSFYCFFTNYSRKKILPFSLLIFFSISMISIALPGEKMFAFIIGAVYTSLFETRPLFVIDFRRRNEIYENC